MVYKIGNISDLTSLPLVDVTTLKLLYHHARALSREYGENRNINTDDGGYILFAVPGTEAEELKSFFDVSRHLPEYVNSYDSICEAIYLLNNDYAVVIIMSISDAPTEILNEIE